MENKINLSNIRLYDKTIKINIEKNINSLIEKAESVQKWIESKPAWAVSFNQLGFSERCFIIKNGKIGLIDNTIINPTFETCKNSKVVNSFETCLSFPGEKFTIKRNKMIKMSYYSISLKKYVTIKLHGMSAIVCQHEISHLDGKFHATL